MATTVSIIRISTEEVPQLSREMAWAAADHGEIFVTWANEHFSDFALNWATHLKEVGVQNILVGAMDVGAAKVSASGGGLVGWGLELPVLGYSRFMSWRVR